MRDDCRDGVAWIWCDCGALGHRRVAVVAAGWSGGDSPRRDQGIGEDKHVEDWTPPRTPWGNPDLEGTYTNKDENQIPLERPDQFGGKRVEDVGDAELAELIKERAAQAEKVTLIPQMLIAGPTNWYEFLNPKNSRSWLDHRPGGWPDPAVDPRR